MASCEDFFLINDVLCIESFCLNYRYISGIRPNFRLLLLVPHYKYHSFHLIVPVTKKQFDIKCSVLSSNLKFHRLLCDESGNDRPLNIFGSNLSNHNYGNQPLA